MIYFAIGFPLVCILLFFYIGIGSKRIEQLNKEAEEIEALACSLYNAARKGAPEGGQEDIATLASRLANAYAEQTDNYDKIDIIRKSMIRVAVLTAAIGILAAITVLFGV